MERFQGGVTGCDRGVSAESLSLKAIERSRKNLAVPCQVFRMPGTVKAANSLLALGHCPATYDLFVSLRDLGHFVSKAIAFKLKLLRQAEHPKTRRSNGTTKDSKQKILGGFTGMG